jgi:hypothetical protein
MTVTDRRQTRPLLREDAPQRQHSNFHKENNIWSRVPEWTWHWHRLTVSRKWLRIWQQKAVIGQSSRRVVIRQSSRTVVTWQSSKSHLLGELHRVQIWTRRGSFRRWRVSCESRATEAVVRGQFENWRKGTSADGGRYQRTSEVQQTKRIQCL